MLASMHLLASLIPLFQQRTPARRHSIRSDAGPSPREGASPQLPVEAQLNEEASSLFPAWI